MSDPLLKPEDIKIGDVLLSKNNEVLLYVEKDMPKNNCFLTIFLYCCGQSWFGEKVALYYESLSEYRIHKS